MNQIDNNSFKTNVIGIDPITKGTFIIEHAYMIWGEWADENGDCAFQESHYQGKIVITSENDNPLYKIAKEQPLRLQGLIASVQFVGEKRFIKIRTIVNYIIRMNMNCEDDGVELNPVTFEILDNLNYLEAIDIYREDNLL
jgi:hypothetical protein